MPLAQVKPDLPSDDVEVLRRYVPIIEMTEELEHRSGSNERGKWERTKQRGFLHTRVLGRSLLQECKIDLGTSSPYRPGLYTFASEAWEVNQYGDVALKRFEKPLVYIAASPSVE